MDDLTTIDSQSEEQQLLSNGSEPSFDSPMDDSQLSSAVDDAEEDDDEDIDFDLSDFACSGTKRTVADVLKNDYQATLPCLVEGPLNEAMSQSIFSDPARPLIICIHSTTGFNRHIFWQSLLKNDSILNCLNDHFLVWATKQSESISNDLITMFAEHLGEEITGTILSVDMNDYPLMVCLRFHAGEISVASVIRGVMSDMEILNQLIDAREVFQASIVLPYAEKFQWNRIDHENWSIGSTNLICIEPESTEYTWVVADFNQPSSSRNIISIHRVDNPVWLMTYIQEKERIDTQRQDHDSEKLLFHGCPYASAENILQQGFKHQLIGKNGTYIALDGGNVEDRKVSSIGTLLGRGFYFSSTRSVSDFYAKPDPQSGSKRILICRVLVGRPCRGSSNIAKCPVNFDSTTNFSDTYVIYSNRQVYPEYLITYR